MPPLAPTATVHGGSEPQNASTRYRLSFFPKPPPRAIGLMGLQRVLRQIKPIVLTGWSLYAGAAGGMP